ncbi:MAG: beta-1,3-glucanase [Pseudonocardiaceae bacterium]|nr:beta-1,3-glucanase [Pseudonocardiaceae bacterium]
MISRRSMLGVSAAALAAPVLGRFLPFQASAAAAPDTFTLRVVNDSGAGAAYAYVTGTSPDDRIVVLKPDGTPYYPPSPAEQTPLEDCAIPLQGSGTELTVPRMSGARVYIATEEKLEFFVNPGPALVAPSFLDENDANYQKNWSFCEFTFNDTQLYANISYVDFVSIPLGLYLTTSSSGEQTVAGLPAGAIDVIAGELAKQQDAEWGQLVHGDGPVRVVSPHYREDLFTDYLAGYIDEAWQKYTGETLTVDTQRPELGKVNGKVGGDGKLTFDGAESFGKPVTADVFSCDTGPFQIKEGDSDVRKAIVPRLAAALNRTTLRDNPNQPHGEDPNNFYQNSATNHYARIVHQNLPDNRGYAFPYDDVAPEGVDFSGAVIAGDPEVLTVTVSAMHTQRR